MKVVCTCFGANAGRWALDPGGSSTPSSGAPTAWSWSCSACTSQNASSTPPRPPWPWTGPRTAPSPLAAAVRQRRHAVEQFALGLLALACGRCPHAAPVLHVCRRRGGAACRASPTALRPRCRPPLTQWCSTAASLCPSQTSPSMPTCPSAANLPDHTNYKALSWHHRSACSALSRAHEAAQQLTLGGAAG
jgi:hypothetical protein